jgi:hypothetical protein
MSEQAKRTVKGLESVLQEANTPGFWGHIELDFNDGELVVIRKTETTKLRTRKGDNRDECSPSARK